MSPATPAEPDAMPRHAGCPAPDALPTLTRLEGMATAWGPARWAIDKFHQQRKKRFMGLEKARDAADPLALRNFERKVYSQYGEDGILAEIFARIGEGGKFAAEFGIEDGTECCTRLLIERHGWSGVLLDGSTSYVASARSLYEAKPVKVLERFITAENVASLFAEVEVPAEPDLLSIDVDGNDYWIWRASLAAYRPRVVVIEYNGRWVPPVTWVMAYESGHRWDLSVRFGASLESLTRLGTDHGYRLVACNFAGNNAFFVREDQLGDRFPDADRGASYHFAAPLYGLGFGHPVRPRRPIGS